MTEKDKKQKFNEYNFMNVYDNNRAILFKTKIDENPTIVKKGKKIDLRSFVNEGFEAADLMTNLKKFGNAENIKKEQAFLMLDEKMLNADFRDLLDIQKFAKDIYSQLSVEDRRNMSEKDFINFKKNENKIKENNEQIEQINKNKE